MSLLPGSKWDAPYNRGTGAYAAAAMPQQQQPQLGMRGAFMAYQVTGQYQGPMKTTLGY